MALKKTESWETGSKETYRIIEITNYVGPRKEKRRKE
jgi:hypothetical protein